MSLHSFYLSNLDLLYNNKKIRDGILSYKETYGFYKEKIDKKLFTRILSSLIEESELAISLIDDRSKSLLEIGGGIGLAYGYLKYNGVDITSIEPGEPGFNISYDIGNEILNVLQIDPLGWYQYKAEELKKLNKQFDQIFSNNVIEHITKIEEAIIMMASVLKPNGHMTHSCPNYLIPYDCHYKTLLVPFFPKLFHSKLEKEPLWNNINFITSYKLRSICKNNNLTILFKPNMMYSAFVRLETSPEFRLRHRGLWTIYRLIKNPFFMEVIKYIPGWLSTPMTVIIK
jgi:2-polyprenyl-3-methyl-5-hydroxy-6-metoxy-1,4-benzoquinol methylase